jgi:hypothetical protein
MTEPKPLASDVLAAIRPMLIARASPLDQLGPPISQLVRGP